ncbi:Rod shape-determining protein MreD [Deinococcus sp.]|uniref:Rod shape-determining protein MreD n=1 Tax=Deinococcus sp. TaxID=47478 RepID=UPI0025B8FAD3|nr:Rod shape-determining protein MreD [Deinococcus sp.]
MSVPVGPPWLMILGYVVALLVLQSALSRLLSPLGVPPPDLFLLTGIALARRTLPVSALLGAYALGLAQDILGAGALGLHAAALAGGTLLVLLTRRAAGSRAGQGLLSVLAAVLGQWLTFMFLTYWLRTGLVTAESLVHILPLSLLTTLIAAPLWNWFADYALGRVPDGLE